MADDQTTAETAEQFALRLTTTVSSGFVTLAVAIGVRTGLFVKLGDQNGPRTSAQIAEAAGMKERYVREWLAIMVTARIMEYDREQRTYFLPPHRRDVLKSAQMPEGLRLQAGVATNVADCFKLDGPEESGIRVHDAGCGRGIPTLILAQHFRNSTFVGTDLDRDAVQWAATESNRLGLVNTKFQVQDLAKLPADWSDSFDYVLAWDAIHDQADPEVVLREIYRTTKSSGLFSMVDIRGHTELADNLDDPAAPMLYGASLLHCMPVSLYFGGRGLGTMWGQELAVSMLREARFTNIRCLDVPDSPANLHFLCQKP
uniref:Uncharacterized protein n=1 Tax=Branchiostoma floridae TaxID=7739 RepID=C3YVK8_BRAFL|eukprot:XP_002599719.1 hypothetical protein BRAFLDRAFT_106707 [Branchiostoma floridae]